MINGMYDSHRKAADVMKERLIHRMKLAGVRGRYTAIGFVNPMKWSKT